MKIPMLIKCIECKRLQAIEVEPADIIKYQEGMKVQDAFPYLQPHERELLISGYCKKCWDWLFSNQDVGTISAIDTKPNSKPLTELEAEALKKVIKYLWDDEMNNFIAATDYVIQSQDALTPWIDKLIEKQDTNHIFFHLMILKRKLMNENIY